MLFLFRWDLLLRSHLKPAQIAISEADFIGVNWEIGGDLVAIGIPETWSLFCHPIDAEPLGSEAPSCEKWAVDSSFLLISFPLHLPLIKHPPSFVQTASSKMVDHKLRRLRLRLDGVQTVCQSDRWFW